MSTPTPRAALKRLIELEDAASANGADPDMTAWDDAVAAGRAALNTEPDRPTLAEAALCALERIQHGDASSGSDDFDLVANALGQLRRYDAILPAPYIDPQGEDADKQLLEVFYRQMGRGLEVRPAALLRGIRGVRAFQFAPATPPALSATSKITGLAWPKTLGDWNLMGPPNRLGAWRWYRRTVYLDGHPAKQGGYPIEQEVKMDSQLQPMWESLVEVDDLDGPPSTFPALRPSPATPPAPAKAESGLTRQSAIHAFRSQLTKEASSRYGLTPQDAEFDAFTSGASWAWATYATATAGGFGQAPQAGEGE